MVVDVYVFFFQVGKYTSFMDAMGAFWWLGHGNHVCPKIQLDPLKKMFESPKPPGTWDLLDLFDV